MKAAIAACVMCVSFNCTASAPVGELDSITVAVGNLETIDVGVVKPDGRWVSIKDFQLVCTGVRVAGENVTVDLAAAVGRNYENDKDEGVFVNPGSYRLYIARNLETDLDGSDAFVRTVIVDAATAGRNRRTSIGHCTGISSTARILNAL